MCVRVYIILYIYMKPGPAIHICIFIARVELGAHRIVNEGATGVIRPVDHANMYDTAQHNR